MSLVDNLEARMVPQARSRQQFVMTSVNNLTLLLSEALQQMRYVVDQPERHYDETTSNDSEVDSDYNSEVDDEDDVVEDMQLLSKVVERGFY